MAWNKPQGGGRCCELYFFGVPHGPSGLKIVGAGSPTFKCWMDFLASDLARIQMLFIMVTKHGFEILTVEPWKMNLQPRRLHSGHLSQ